MQRARFTSAILFCLCLFYGQISDAAHAATATNRLRALLASVCPAAGCRVNDTDQDPLKDLARFYREFDYTPVWASAAWQANPVPVAMPDMARADSLGAATGGIDSGLPAWETLTPEIQWEMAVTHRLIREARERIVGHVAPETLPRPWLVQRPSRTRDIPVELATAIKENRLAGFMETLAPKSAAYRKLQKALTRYETILKEGQFPTIPTGPTMRPGDSGNRVRTLIHRLGLTGDLKIDRPMADPTDRYTALVLSAVKRFQRRHGLKSDGVVGRQTLAALNVPVEKRIEQLRLNMERCRWLPDSFGNRYLVVNIPAFELRVVDKGVTQLELPAIVGRKRRQTPVMSGEMTYLEFNPYWNIPRRIARRDILPKVIQDPDYLSRQGIRIFENWDADARELAAQSIDWQRVSPRAFPYRLRQDPSRHNALGQVKFMFPNHQSVYIHDTPGKALFKRQRRIFSSGCVRVASPLTLANMMLESQGWDEKRLEQVIDDGQRKVVVLNAPLPVHLVYFTAWVAEDGRIQFREDVYGRDGHLLAALQRATRPSLFCSKDPADWPTPRTISGVPFARSDETGNRRVPIATGL